MISDRNLPDHHAISIEAFASSFTAIYETSNKSSVDCKISVNKNRFRIKTSCEEMLGLLSNAFAAQKG